jgi:hypothetical protein
MTELGYFDAYDQALVPLTNTVALLDLLARLEPTGVVHLLREPTSAAGVGERAGLDAATTETMLRALRSLASSSRATVSSR